jgi:hypothetical protein
MRRVVVALVAVVLFTLSACGGEGRSTAAETEMSEWEKEQADRAAMTTFEQAQEDCSDSAYIEIGDEGYTLTMTSQGKDSPGATFEEIACILDALDTPDAVVSQMDRTRALDGIQEATWEDITASWSYHPDSGINLILQQEE